MSEPSSTQPPATGPDGRPLGPDGKPLPGPQQMQQVMAQRRMAQQQAQVDEVVGIMRNNVEKAGFMNSRKMKQTFYIFLLHTILLFKNYKTKYDTGIRKGFKIV